MIIEPYLWQRVDIIDVAPASVDTLTIRFTRPPHYNFSAGQYTVVRITTESDRLIVRQYSLSSSPREDYLELTIQKEKGGEVSTWLDTHAVPGASVEITQPFGSFLEIPSERHIVFIAGRVGIAPFMSVLRDQTDASRFHVLYSVRSESQICYREELRSYDSHFFVSEEKNRITTDSLRPFVGMKPVVYLCGSRDFVEAMQLLAHESGIPEDDVRRELFTL